MTDISIIILSYNTKDLLAQTLDSVNHAACSEVVMETIVADNGSSDGSVEMVKELYPWVKLIENKENLGFSAGNNRGVEVAQGRYLLFLNSDTKIIGDAIKYVYSRMEQDKDIGVGSCRVELANGEIDWACHRGFPTPWRAFCYYSGLEKLTASVLKSTGDSVLRKTLGHWFGGYHLLSKDLSKEHEIDACIGAFMLVPREIGEKINWWDEDFFFYGEDLDFCFKVKELGKKVVYFPQVKILHLKHQSGLKKKESSPQLTGEALQIKQHSTSAFYDAMTVFYKKHYVSKYPSFVTQLVFWGIGLKKSLALKKLQ